MNLATILAAINAGVTLIPEGAALVGELKGVFNETDQAAIEKALADANAAADAQHEEAQSL